MGRFGIVALAALIVPPWAIPQAQETHPFSVHDMLAMERLSDPQIAPDGSVVALAVRTTDLAANRGRTDLWSAPVDGGAPRRLTTHEAADFHPRWAPDGRDLFFLSTRSGSSQVWRLPLAGGEPRQVTDLPLDVGNLVVSPDGRRIALTMDVFASCETLDCTAERLEDRSSRPTSGVAYDDLFVRHWDVWKDGRRSHVFVLELDDVRSPSGEPVDLMRGLDQDAPPKPFGGAEEIAFGHGGDAVIFASRTGGTPEAWSTNFDLLPGAGGRRFAARQPDRRKPGLGQSPGAVAGRRRAGLAGHGAPRLRIRPFPDPARAPRRFPAGGRAGPHRGLGPLRLGPCLFGPTGKRCSPPRRTSGSGACSRWMWRTAR